MSLIQRVNAAEPGHIIEYHRGYLVRDRYFDKDTPENKKILAQLVDRIANDARELAEDGKVLLTQRRISHGLLDKLGIMAYAATRAVSRGDYWTKPAEYWQGVKRHG